MRKNLKKKIKNINEINNKLLNDKEEINKIKQLNENMKYINNRLLEEEEEECKKKILILKYTKATEIILDCLFIIYLLEINLEYIL